MLYVRYPLSLRSVEDLAFERGIDICRETVRESRPLGPDVRGEVRKRRIHAMRQYTSQVTDRPVQQDCEFQ